MLVTPPVSGMNQNQPWSNQKIEIWPSVLPGSRVAPSKWPKIAALLCSRMRCLVPKRLARKVSRPEASTTNFVCQVRSLPSSWSSPWCP